MLRYFKQEIRDLRNPESGRVREVYKVLLDRGDSAEEFMSHLSRHSRMGPGTIEAAMIYIAHCLGERLAETGSVTLPGVGTISLAIRPKEGRAKGLIDRSVEGAETDADGDAQDSGDAAESHELNARSMELHHLNFRPAKELMDDVAHRIKDNGGYELVWGRGGVRLHKPRQARRLERFAAARAYLAEHEFMRVSDYAELTGLSLSSAQRELRLARELDHSGLAAKGRGSHRVYVLRKD